MSCRPSFRPMLERLEDRLTASLAFAGQSTFAVGGVPQSVATADFNGDGKPDLVTADSGADTVSLLLNTTTNGVSTPSFAAAVTFAVGSDPGAVAVGDFNGDGKLDIAVANTNDGTVSVLLNTTAVGATAPAFAAAVTFAVGTSPDALAVGDFNGDHKMDLVVANFGDNTVSVLLDTTGTGASVPTFVPQKTFAVGHGPTAVAVGDFNEDGATDLAVANGNDGTASLLLNTTAVGASVPSFAPQQIIAETAPLNGNDAAVGNPRSLAVGDINLDGKADLVVANYGTVTLNGGDVSVLLNTTTTGSTTVSFSPPQVFNAAAGSYTNPDAVAVGDVDGDGRPDIVVTDPLFEKFAGYGLAVLLNTTGAGATAASFSAPVSFTVGTSPSSVALADFNHDSRLDIAVANVGDATASVLLNTTPAGSAAFPAVVADVPGRGVVEYDRDAGAWVQLNTAYPYAASLLAADPQGDVFADYAGYGVSRYSPSTHAWTLLNGQDAEALAVDAQGDAFLSIPGAGIGEFRLNSTARLVTPSAAALLAADAQGDLVADFTGYGVQRYTASAGFWTPLNGQDAVALAVDAAGDAFASFAGAGVGEFRADGSARLLTPFAASSLVSDGAGDVAADFAGYGVQRLAASSSGWTPLNGHDALSLAIDADGGVFASFSGAGVGEFLSDGSSQLVSAQSATLLAADPFDPPV